MEFVGDIFGAVASGGLGAVLGGVTGLVGTWLKSRHERQMAEIQSQERQADRAHDMAMLRMEGENAVKIAEVHRQEADDVASAASLQASYKMEPQRYAEGMTFSDGWFGKLMGNLTALLMFLLDFLRGAMRPGLTLYMAIVVTLIYWEMQSLMVTFGITMTPDQVTKILFTIIGMFCYLLVTAYVWWFGDRNRQKPPPIKV